MTNKTLPSGGRRSSGLLLHPTSLPSAPYIGDLGPAARAFADALQKAGQRWWQMLPIGPTGMGQSPYDGLSAFAGNPLLISLDDLVTSGYLAKNDLPVILNGATGYVHFDNARRLKMTALRKAYNRFHPNKAFWAFCQRESAWLRPFALFIALKMRNHECSWPHWSERKADDPIFENEVRFHQFVQFLFFEQWDRLHAYCTRKGVGLIGDLPIYVAHDSADVWSNPGLFYLDKDGRSSFVAGTPPDYFSKTGQLWGNPLYRWDVHKRTGYKWWRARLQHMLRLFDALRIDHFIGFRRYWKIDARHAEAKSGQWVDGPGADFFEKTLSKTERARIIAEDLGATGPDVEDLRDEFGFPGMRVLQFSFEPNSLSTIRGHCVVYTGTHDNDTTRGWFEKLPDKVKKTVLRDINGKSATISTDLMRTALELPTTLAIFPVQDVLGLGSQARMNRPGTAYGNWSWRLEEGQFAGSVLTELRQLTQKHGRS